MIIKLHFVVFLIVSYVHMAHNHYACRLRDYGHGSDVCVCNSNYCDTVEVNIKLPTNKYAVYQTTKKGDRLSKRVEEFNATHTWQPRDSEAVTITVDPSVKYQTILGFGGAVTDATGINIAKLAKPAQQKLIEAYFSPDGVEYSMLRVPMASCDFSTRVYSYDDVDGDFQLRNFSLAQEDTKLKIPFIKQAIGVSQRDVKIFASPWSAPAWMKTSNSMIGNGTLKGSAGDKYHKSWANYFLQFLTAYATHNVSVWGITVQNEPSTGFIHNYSFQTMGFTPEMTRDFVAKDLGPALRASRFRDVKIMIHDDQRLLLPDWADRVLASTDAAQYISGVAVHWYSDWATPPKLLSEVHHHHPTKFVLGTEACAGALPHYIPQGVELGSWERAEDYMSSIMDDLTNWVAGWVEWNLALDPTGGPNWVKNYVDASVIVNASAGEFYKQPTFYVLGHYSKFLPAGSVRVGCKVAGDAGKLQALAFTSTDNSTVVMVTNRNDVEVELQVVTRSGRHIPYTSPPHSIQTFIWWQ